MKIRRPAILASLCLLSGTLLYFQFPNQSSPLPTPTPPPTPTYSPPDQRMADLQPSSPSEQAVPTSPIETGAIEDEAILVFDNAAALEAFLSTADAKGYRVISFDPRLKSARIHIENAKQRAALERSGIQTDNNYTLLTPLPVDSLSYAELGTFENTALDFMRVPHDSKRAGEGITIAILDTGIRAHETLEGLTILQQDISDSPENSDYASHGTAVASLIVGQNGTGIAPAAKLIGIRVLDTEGIGNTFTLAEGIVRAVDSGANIINMSLGSYGTNQALANAVDYANSKGVVLVAAAGNDGVNVLPYPAAYDNVLAVSAIDVNAHPTHFANQSNQVTISAPGVGVYAAWGDQDWIRFTGTSASTPFVSGAIANISSQMNLTVSEATTLLIANANDSGLPGTDPQLGAGYIDIQRTLDSTTSYTDLAIADIYLNPKVDENNQHTTYLTIQNRGTTPLSSTILNYTLSNNITQTVYLGPLAPGEVTSHNLTIPTSELNSISGYKIKTEVNQDDVPGNNSLETILKITQSEPTP